MTNGKGVDYLVRFATVFRLILVYTDAQYYTAVGPKGRGKMMTFVFKMMTFVFKMMNLVFKMMNFGRHRLTHFRAGGIDPFDGPA